MKRAPVTELPWRARCRNDLLEAGDRIDCYWEFEGGRGYLTDGVAGFDLTGWIVPADALYIVHACNAYPKLVEALRTIIESDGGGLTAGEELLIELKEIE